MKRIFSIILAFVLMFSTVYAEEDFLSVYDGGKIISPAVEKYILTQNILLSEETEARIIVATDSATGELTVTEYARKLYEDLGVGYIGRKNTIFLFLCEPADDYHVIVSEGISAALTTEQAQKILIECMEADFDKGNIDEAVIKTYNAFANWFCDKYGTELLLTEDMKEYKDIIRNETNERNLKVFLIVFLVLSLVFGFLWVVGHIRRKRRMDKLRKKRQERRKRYMKID